VPDGGRAEFQLRDGTALRLDQESAMDILALDKDSFQFYLAEGHVYANFAGLRGSLLQIDTALSSVRTYDNAIFRIDISRDGYTDVSAYKVLFC
jgi:ferric-dicitrate binding protein FerR (iron transport regulator)